MYGALSITTTILMDGEPVGQVLLLDITADLHAGKPWAEIERTRARLSVCVAEWRILLADGTRASGNALPQMWEWCSAHRVDYLFCADLMRTASIFDAFFLGCDGARWAHIDDDEAYRDDAGRYVRRVDREAWTDRSGTTGQRYRYSVWTRAECWRKNRTKAQSLHGVDVYGLGAIYGRTTWAQLCADFGADAATECGQIMQILAHTDAANGGNWLGKTKPHGYTISAIGYRAMQKSLQKIAKKNPLSAWQYRQLRSMQLMRGGICYAAPDAIGAGVIPLHGAEMYDINSSYGAVARDMPTICGEPQTVDAAEWWHRVPGYVYIGIVDYIDMHSKDGAAIWTPPHSDAPTADYCGRFGTPWAVYAEELDAWATVYDIAELSFAAVLRCKCTAGGDYAPWATDLYNHRREAKKAGDTATAAALKGQINGALGKLAAGDDYGTVWHAIGDDGIVHAVQRDIDNTHDPRRKKYSGKHYLQGAYVAAIGRVRWINAIRDACNGDIRAHLLYGDTDSALLVGARIRAPQGEGMGQWHRVDTVRAAAIVGRKAYAYTDEEGRITAHVRGIPQAALYDYIRYNGGDGTAALACVSAAALVPSRLSLLVRGGRCDIIVYRPIGGDAAVQSVGDMQFVGMADGLAEL